MFKHVICWFNKHRFYRHNFDGQKGYCIPLVVVVGFSTQIIGDMGIVFQI